VKDQAGHIFVGERAQQRDRIEFVADRRVAGDDGAGRDVKRQPAPGKRERCRGALFVAQRIALGESKSPKFRLRWRCVHDPSSAVLYYYQVRNNLSHRGKGAWVDGEIIRASLQELKAIFDAVLKQEA